MNNYEKLARACILLHKGGAWTHEDYEKWKEYTNSVLVTTKSLCDFARKIIAEEEGKNVR
jgi:hypothetical protein